MSRILVGIAFVLCASAPVAAQRVPVFENGTWSLPGSSRQPEEAVFTDGSYEDMIYEVCANEGCHVSPETMIRVMNCESGGDHAAIGPNGELGIMQIDPSYWGAAYGSPYQQIQFAAAHLGNDVYWACL